MTKEVSSIDNVRYVRGGVRREVAKGNVSIAGMLQLVLHNY